jgi:hypothetical protein
MLKKGVAAEISFQNLKTHLLQLELTKFEGIAVAEKPKASPFNPFEDEDEDEDPFSDFAGAPTP